MFDRMNGKDKNQALSDRTPRSARNEVIMEDNIILSQLEALVLRLGITLRYEPLKIDGSIHSGGFCRIKGQDFVIIHKKATPREKIYILIEAVKR